MSSSNVTVADDSNFDRLLLKSDKPVLIKFGTQYCPPCRLLAPIIDRIADEGVGKYRVLSVDIDQAPRVATRYGIRAVPTLLAFKDGAPRGQLVGLTSRDAVLKLLA
jgi:thioredoxin 1